MDIFISSPEEAIDRFRELSEGNGFSCVTAQPVEFLVYHEVAKQVLLRTRPDLDLTDKVVLRYPLTDKAVKSTKELFSRFKPVEDFDTQFNSIASILISASPSLEQKESDESAWGIFVDPRRGELDIDQYIQGIFMKGKIPLSLFHERIDQLIAQAPTSKLGGVLTVITAKEKTDVADFVYDALPYGLPGIDPKNPQLRIVSGALLPSDKIKMHRVLMIEETTLQAFTEKVGDVVAEIFFHNERSLKKIEKKVQQQAAPQEIALDYLKHYELDKALPWVLKSDESIRYEFFKVMSVLWAHQYELEKAKDAIFAVPEGYKDAEKCLGRLAVIYLDSQVSEEILGTILKRMKDGDEKNLVLLYAQSLGYDRVKYCPHPDYVQDVENMSYLFDIMFDPLFDDEDEEDEIEELQDMQPLWAKHLDASASTNKVLA